MHTCIKTPNQFLENVPTWPYFYALYVNGESDLNTNIVFSIPWSEPLSWREGRKTSPFFLWVLRCSDSGYLLEWLWYEPIYDTSSGILLGHFESIACFSFLSNIIPVFYSDKRYKGNRTTTKLLYEDLPEPVAESPFLLKAAYFYDLVRK